MNFYGMAARLLSAIWILALTFGASIIPASAQSCPNQGSSSASVVITNNFDAAGRLTGQSFSDTGNATQFNLDAAGNPTTKAATCGTPGGGQHQAPELPPWGIAVMMIALLGIARYTLKGKQDA